MKEFKLGELFCGSGGIGLAAKNTKIKGFSIEHAWANDIDIDSCKTYTNNVCKDPTKVKIGDIRNIDLNELEKIDALTFGFPCNDFSIVGKQQGIYGKYGTLFEYGLKIIKKDKPDWFLAENVGGLKSANNGTTFKIISNELKKAGYTLTTHLYKFEEYSIPQTRHRLIFVGIRNDLNLKFKVPKPSKRYITCKEAICNPPIPKDSFNNELTKQSKKVIERLKLIRPGMNVFNSELPENLRLNVKGAKLSQIYKRLDPKKPSYTVTGSGGGGTHVYHWEEPRALTNRERARLQTFPDEFEFLGSKESVRKQIGMAVPPAAAKIILTAILKTFAKINYESIEPNIYDM
tara:strand:+ start:53 stop:1093 length:1041 start_codon:yes stop_codon:yes gene_type:complete